MGTLTILALAKAVKLLVQTAGGRGVLITGVACLVALLPHSAQAHARVLTVDPGPGDQLTHAPGAVSISFSEPVTQVGLGIMVTSPSGRRISRGRAHEVASTLSVQIADAGQGTYTVSWRAVARDTHPTSGTYTFDVGHASAQTASLDSAGLLTPAGVALVAAAGWLHFLGFAFAFGSLAFGVLVLPNSSDPGGESGDARLLSLSGAGVGLLLGSVPVALIGQSVSLGGLDQLDLQSLFDVLGSPFGLVLALRAGAALMLWSLLGAFRLAGAGVPWALALGGALAGVDAASAHALRSLPGWAGWAALPGNALHEAAMGVWVGGLAALLLTWRGRPWVLRRFGQVALAAVVVLAVSGALLALGSLRGPADLLVTAYGRVLSLKTVIFAVALVLAGVGLRGRAGGAWRIEVVAVAALLGLAGLLIALPPPS